MSIPTLIYTNTQNCKSIVYAKVGLNYYVYFMSMFQSPSNQYQAPTVAVTRTRGLLPVLPQREVENPFHMLLASQLECVDCKYRHPVKYDLNSSLSLVFPKNAWVCINRKYPHKVFAVQSVMFYFQSAHWQRVICCSVHFIFVQ